MLIIFTTAWTPRQDISSHASFFEEDEENVAKESVDPNKSWGPYPMSFHGFSNLHNSQSKDTIWWLL